METWAYVFITTRYLVIDSTDEEAVRAHLAEDPWSGRGLLEIAA